MYPSLSCTLSLMSLGAFAVRVESTNGTYWPWQTFKSEPSLQPPVLEIIKNGTTQPGYLFFTQDGSYGHNYSRFIMADDGELVYQAGHGEYTDFRAQEFDGKAVLSFFNGITFSEPNGWGYGVLEIQDDSYQSIYNVTVNGTGLNTLGSFDRDSLQSWLDMHEATITSEGTMLATLYNITQTDLTSVGGPEDGWLADCLFYEIDIKTNKILYQWSAIAHKDQIPLVDALPTYPLKDYGQNSSFPWGPFHINTVNKLDDGSWLISSRHYCSIFLLHPNGTVAWTLHGLTGGSFTLDEGVDFCYQHDVRVSRVDGNIMDVTLFNNANAGPVWYEYNQTTGLHLRLDQEALSASLLLKLTDPNDVIYARSQGNLQVLPNGNSLMGYGSTARIKEYHPDGSLAMSVRFGGNDNTVFSYRAYRKDWVGYPASLPKAYACQDKSANQTRVYMSWNGATEHRSWNVYAGSDKTSLAPATQARKTGFETSTTVSGLASYVRVEALGRKNMTNAVSDILAVEEQC